MAVISMATQRDRIGWLCGVVGKQRASLRSKGAGYGPVGKNRFRMEVGLQRTEE